MWDVTCARSSAGRRLHHDDRGRKRIHIRHLERSYQVPNSFVPRRVHTKKVLSLRHAAAVSWAGKFAEWMSVHGSEPIEYPSYVARVLDSPRDGVINPLIVVKTPPRRVSQTLPEPVPSSRSIAAANKVASYAASSTRVANGLQLCRGRSVYAQDTAEQNVWLTRCVFFISTYRSLNVTPTCRCHPMRTWDSHSSRALEASSGSRASSWSRVLKVYPLRTFQYGPPGRACSRPAKLSICRDLFDQRYRHLGQSSYAPQ